MIQQQILNLVPHKLNVYTYCIALQTLSYINETKFMYKYFIYKPPPPLVSVASAGEGEVFFFQFPKYTKYLYKQLTSCEKHACNNELVQTFILYRHYYNQRNHYTSSSNSSSSSLLSSSSPNLFLCRSSSESDFSWISSGSTTSLLCLAIL